MLVLFIRHSFPYHSSVQKKILLIIKIDFDGAFLSIE